MSHFDVIVLYDKGPATRLTPDEADRLACVCFIDHDHKASKPQAPLYWFRLGNTMEKRINIPAYIAKFAWLSVAFVMAVGFLDILQFLFHTLVSLEK